MPTAQLDLSYIAEPLRPFALPIADLQVDPDNARRHGKANLQAIEDSLRRFGQRLPLIVQREGMIVRVGNARLIVAQQLGWTHVACLVYEDEEDIQRAFAIIENRSAELAEWDAQNLSLLLAALQDSPIVDVRALGWQEEELARLIARATPPNFPFPTTATLPGEANVEGPRSEIKMVQLFLTVESFPEFAAMVEKLASQYGTDNATDTVMECLRRACSQS